ncbi:MAG TPA: DUF4173 domain-containing protein [Bacteroidales bacterium]|nr:DUF4173 domain-containing protein [Bacteroidales bacterium]HSA43029.1 DUF4173 domain-containing protein [Bacteroidales bacterium]
MNNYRISLAASLLSAFMITALFYRQAPGLNLLLAETILILAAFFTGQLRLKGPFSIISLCLLFLTASYTLLLHSVYSYLVHAIMVMVFAGYQLLPAAKSPLTALQLSMHNLYLSQGNWLRQSTDKVRFLKAVRRPIQTLGMLLIPLAVIAFFVILYRLSNPVFDHYLVNMEDILNDWLGWWFRYINMDLAVTFVFSLLISNSLFFAVARQAIVQKDTLSDDILIRSRKRLPGKRPITALLKEYRAAVFLLASLNCILLIVNMIDINWVWFNFSWNGQYLKQFVHEGTWLLILSILSAIAILLYYFRDKLHFYSRNKTLKILSTLWLVQNAILAVSVGIRNYWYVYYFSLAYKRIAVVFFLILCIYGLYTIYLKIRHARTVFYLLRTNTLALLIILVLTSAVQWDRLIASYNFRHANRAFLHFDFLAGLSDKTLPWLDHPLDELKLLEQKRRDKFGEEAGLMTAESYYHRIQERKQAFLKRHEASGWTEWNLPEHLAAKKLHGKIPGNQ